MSLLFQPESRVSLGLILPARRHVLGRGFAGKEAPSIQDDVRFGKIYIRIDGDVDELEKLAKKFESKNAKVMGEIQTKPWGLRDLTVEDADGVSRIPQTSPTSDCGTTANEC